MTTPAIASFAAEARVYCDFIARASALPLEARLAAARDRVLHLYLAGLALPPEPPVGEVEAPEAEAMTPPGWQDFGAWDVYYEVYDPYDHADEERVAGSLSDDLLDIYFDVTSGLALWDGGHAVEAVWAWRFHFDIHWGDHAVDALRALHRANRPIPGAAGNP